MSANDSYPSVASALLDRDLGDEYLLYDRESGQIHILNPTARTILKLCDGTRSVAQVARGVAEHYSIDLERATADVEELLDELGEKGIVRLRGRAERSA